MDNNTMIVLLIVAAMVSAYLLPSIIGFQRGVSSRGTLLALNLALGWTVLGWIVCLIWAVSGATSAQDEFYRRQSQRPIAAPTQPQANPWG